MRSLILNNIINTRRNLNLVLQHVKILREGQAYSTSVPLLPDPAALKILPENDIKEFNSYYPIVRNDIVTNKLVSDIPKLNERLERMLDYNAKEGRKLRPYLMIATYKYFTNEEDRTPENIRLMNILGWFIELMNAAYVMQDDIVDNSETRRGKPTWFKCKDVGINAVFDASLIESTCIQLLKTHFSAHKNYNKMLDAFLEMLRMTRVGFVVEAATVFDEFSEDLYYVIAQHKMGYYLLQFTTTLGTLLANKEDLMICQKAGRVFNELGCLYTIQVSQNCHLILF
ncbi:hypothetical protein WA026_005129 [Henosepilachna vigintioctopunctata]|uniref:Farnesyl pyrophosphate synthase n=1 Tax=Henosepilachna vigintioctopunctata TaxID=420089 RepID=A0AAW1UX57_9CUCU